jgi:hypothetical protein
MPGTSSAFEDNGNGCWMPIFIIYPTTTQWTPKFGIVKHLVCFRGLFSVAFIQIAMGLLEIIAKLAPRHNLVLFTVYFLHFRRLMSRVA